jgi:predicted dehydrogenase
VIDPGVEIGHVHRRYGIGILGLGVQGVEMLTSFAASERFRVVAAFDPGVAAAVVPLLASAGEVIAHPEVDCLYCASPPAHHETALLAAVAAGLPVLCEKPLAPTGDAAARMAAAAAAAGVACGVNFYLATSPAGRGLARAVTAGTLGSITELRLGARFRAWPRPWQAAAGDWLTGSAEGGFSREVVSHFVFLADRLVGPGTVESAIVERGSDGLERRLQATVRYATARLVIDAAIGGDVAESNRFDVTGAAGSAAIVDWDELEGAAPLTEGAGPVSAFAALLDGLAGDLPDLAAGARVVEIVEAMLA